MRGGVGFEGEGVEGYVRGGIIPCFQDPSWMKRGACHAWSQGIRTRDQMCFWPVKPAYRLFIFHLRITFHLHIIFLLGVMSHFEIVFQLIMGLVIFFQLGGTLMLKLFARMPPHSVRLVFSFAEHDQQTYFKHSRETMWNFLREDFLQPAIQWQFQ